MSPLVSGGAQHGRYAPNPWPTPSKLSPKVGASGDGTKPAGCSAESALAPTTREPGSFGKRFTSCSSKKLVRAAGWIRKSGGEVSLCCDQETSGELCWGTLFWAVLAGSVPPVCIPQAVNRASAIGLSDRSNGVFNMDWSPRLIAPGTAAGERQAREVIPPLRVAFKRGKTRAF